MKDKPKDIYKGYEIYHNAYNKYCVCYKNGEMVEWNSSFNTRNKAQQYIDNKILRQERFTKQPLTP